MKLAKIDVTVSVVIPVYRGGEEFRRCLQSLFQAIPQPQEIIVVADGNCAEDCAIVYETTTSSSTPILVLYTPEPLGPARARNLGAAQANGDVVFFVDADVSIAPDAIGQIQQIFADDLELGAVFGSYDDQPAAANFVSQYKNLMHHYVHQTAREEASTFWSGCGAVRRAVFVEMNGFSSSYQRPCIEDIELGYRMRQVGYRIRLNKQLQGKHLKRWTPVSLIKTDFFQRALPWTELILRDKKIANDLNLDSSSRASVVLTYSLLGALGGSFWWPGLLILALLLAVLLLILNAPLYKFFHEKRGLQFTIQVLPWHWFYYFYGGLAFVLGFTKHFAQHRLGLYARSWLPINGIHRDKSPEVT